MELIDNYYDELVEWSAIIGNFQQLTDTTENANFQFGEESNLDPYTKTTSLLYTAETDDFAEFVNGKPAFLIKYYLILSTGSSKNISDPTGYAPDGDFQQCNFYLDYFWINPLKINEIECAEKVCKIDEKLSHFSWCSTCHGHFNSANNLVNLIHPALRFTKIPKNSIVYIGKTVTPIDDELETAVKVKKFLDVDKQKLNILQARIDATEEKIKKFMEGMNREKRHCGEKIDYLLSIRGGSMEAYLATIQKYDEKLQ